VFVVKFMTRRSHSFSNLSRACVHITGLTLERNQLSFQVKELSHQVDTIQADRVRLTDEAAAALSAKKTLEEQKGALDRELARMEARFEALVQQLKDREEVRSL
jgi:chromosome segregation ATPase